MISNAVIIMRWERTLEEDVCGCGCHGFHFCDTTVPQQGMQFQRVYALCFWNLLAALACGRSWVTVTVCQCSKSKFFSTSYVCFGSHRASMWCCPISSVGDRDLRKVSVVIAVAKTARVNCSHTWIAIAHVNTRPRHAGRTGRGTTSRSIGCAT